jgi:hypothetical protein
VNYSIKCHAYFRSHYLPFPPINLNRQNHYSVISRRTQLHNLRRVKHTPEVLKQGLSGFAPFRVLPFGCSCSFRTSFTFLTLPCALGLILTTSASTVSLASSVLVLLLIGLVVNLSPYLISLSLILSYLISLSYLIVSLFIVWTMIAPATPSHSVLVLSFVPNTGKHGPCAGLCADRLGI